MQMGTDLWLWRVKSVGWTSEDVKEGMERSMEENRDVQGQHDTGEGQKFAPMNEAVAFLRITEV